MPDETTNASNDPTGPVGAAPVENASATGATETPATEQPDIWTQVSTLDPDELMQKHPRLVGKLGEMADKLERRRNAEREAKRQQEESDRLLNEDPEQFAALVKQQRQEDQTRKAAMTEAQTAVTEYFHTLPESVQGKLAGKNYPGSYGEGLKAFMADIVTTALEHHKTDIQEKVEAVGYKKGFTAGHKAALAELNGGAPSADTNTGAAVNGFKMPSLKELDAMPLDEYKKHREKIISRLG